MAEGELSMSRVVGRLVIGTLAAKDAYQIRLHAVHQYGRVIHEFDPWFNYRAAEYLAANGASRFFRWFDHTAWYPLGRPVGSTIYPGMQFASVWTWRVLQHLGIDMSLMDVCVFTPAWFAVVATFFVGLLAYETTGSIDAGLVAALVMAVIPAHLTRSVAGGYDNECVAVSCMCATFYFYCRSIRTPTSWIWGLATGLTYFCMAASWGGYVFVVNMIGVHVALMLTAGRFSAGLHRAYTLFFLVGTGLAIQIPVVGLTPLRSLEQMGPMLVFFWLQLLELCRMVRSSRKMSDAEFGAFQRKAFLAAGAVAAIVAAALFQQGYFGPLSARVRGLFVKHTKTGNPLVDSVAEHRQTSPQAYWRFLHQTCILAPLGLLVLLLSYKTTPAKLFVLLYTAVTYYFSARMNRLLLLMAPVCAVLGGVGLSTCAIWASGELSTFGEVFEEEGDDEPKPEARAAAAARGGKAEANDVAKSAGRPGAQSDKKAKAPAASSSGGSGTAASADSASGAAGVFQASLEAVKEEFRQAVGLRKLAAVLTMMFVTFTASDFYIYCHRTAPYLSHPTIMFKMRKGDEVKLVDDYREAYWWLRDNTPEDSRVMAWWDYGYQINGVANRTTLADGNTWNHEHIATIGWCLTSPESKAHEVIRHWSDYVLLWAGGGGDDVAKSPHMARIATSVYHDVCPGDPTCSSFAMAESLLWKLHGHGIKSGVAADPNLFTEAYTSSNGMVRIFKVENVSTASKEWAADPNNWACDAPGSWHCSGQYPPALSKLIATGKAFRQLEDFNRRAGAATP